MRISILIFPIAILFSCSAPTKDIEAISKTDTIKSTETTLKPIYKDSTYLRYLKIFSKAEINPTDTSQHIFRFTLLRPKFTGNLCFAEVNYQDSTFEFYEFDLKGPDGTGKDQILSKTKRKISKSELSTLDYLIDYSMIWSLEAEETNKQHYLDCHTDIYEASIPNDKFGDVKKNYCFVKRFCSQNKDFVNLGQYILSIAKQENHYQKN